MKKFLGRWNFKNLFVDKEEIDEKREIMLGLEIECYLVDDCGKPNDDNALMDTILNNVNDIYIFRDYYPYQLEIRTRPSSNPSDVVNDLVEKYNNLKREVQGSLGYDVVLRSNMRGCQFCGTHLHISFPNLRTSERERLYDIIAKVLYYFIWDTVLINTNSQGLRYQIPCRSVRLLNSEHISPITTITNITRDPNNGIYGYYDVVVNLSSENSRHRIKSVPTIEFRLFDTTNSLDAIEITLWWFKIMCLVLDFEKIWEKLGYIEPDYLLELAEVQRTIIAHKTKYYNIFGTYISNLVVQICKNYDIRVRYIPDLTGSFADSSYSGYQSNEWSKVIAEVLKRIYEDLKSLGDKK